MEADSRGRGNGAAMALERAEFSWPHFGLQVGKALALSVGGGEGEERIV